MNHDHEHDEPSPTPALPSVLIVSGGLGASGEHLVKTALAQFPQVAVAVAVVPQVRDVAQVGAIVRQAAATHSLLVHTLVDAELRQALIHLAHEQHVATIDLMGPLLSRLTMALGQQPLGQPGLYHQLHQAYFDRIEAIEFAVAHDDGQNPHDWPAAEIVLAGISRTGKTPLSMYLAVQGWKVANVPLVYEVPPPPALFQLDARRVIGLTLDPERLSSHRYRRQQRLQRMLGSAYTSPERLVAEVAMARQIFRQGGFAVVDMTDKPIEEAASEILAVLASRTASK